MSLSKPATHSPTLPASAPVGSMSAETGEVELVGSSAAIRASATADTAHWTPLPPY